MVVFETLATMAALALLAGLCFYVATISQLLWHILKAFDEYNEIMRGTEK